MQGRDVGDRLAPRHREVQVVDVEMDDVEFVGPLEHLLEHHDMMGVAVYAVLVQAQRMPAGGDELCTGH